MGTFSCGDKTYEVDSMGFLVDFDQWDKDFAEGMAPQVGITGGLTKEHWDIINFIGDTFKGTGRHPLVYETCRMTRLRLSDLRRLFPTGYLRGACKLAGVGSIPRHLGVEQHPIGMPETIPFMQAYDKVYRVDVRGFLMDPEEWDEYFAIYKAYDMKVHGGKLSEKHWQIIKYLRDAYAKTKKVPTVYETCEVNNIDLEEFEKLFPDGYHRGALKIAGLRLR